MPSPKSAILLNPVDRLVAWFNPRAGLARLGARSVLASAAHEYAQPSRSRKFYRDGLGPNGIVGQGAAALRAQARHMERNNDVARGILRTMVNNIVGPGGIGVEPQPRRADGSIHEAYAEALREAWRDWCLAPEVTHVFHFAAVQRMVVKTWLRDGEAFSQNLIGAVPFLDHGTRVPFSLELFEADMVPMYHQDMNGGATIAQGIERNAWGRPTAYYVYKGNPMDATGIASLNAAALKRIDAARINHIALRDRIGQMRGITEFASIIGRLEDIKDYEDSERIAAKVAASLTAYIKKTSPEGYESGSAVTDDNGNPIGRDLRMSPGTIIDGLAVGEEIGLIDSTRPNPNVVTFRQGQLRAVAAGIGASYSSISRDYNGTYSAQRQELVEQWINYATLTDEFIGMFLQPVWRSFVQAAHLSGVVPMPRDVRQGSEDDALYIAQAMPWIDPMKEANAFTELVKAGFASEVEVMRKRGVNPRDLLEQVSQWRKKVEEKGLVFSSDAANDKPPPAAPAPEPDSTTADAIAAQASATGALASRMVEVVKGQGETFASAIAQAAARPLDLTLHMPPAAETAPAEPPVFNITNDVHVPRQAAPVLNITNDVHVPQQAATVVNVTNDVQPAPVTVNNAFPSRSEQTVERDEQDEIVKTVTTHHL